MTRFEYITKDEGQMVALLELSQNDGLAARGCSAKLSMPPDDSEGVKSWEHWLHEERPKEWDESDFRCELMEMQDTVNAAALAPVFPPEQLATRLKEYESQMLALNESADSLQEDHEPDSLAKKMREAAMTIDALMWMVKKAEGLV